MTLTSKKIVWSVVSVVVVAFGAWQFSPVFRTSAKVTIGQLTEWTPEAIKRDPVGYADFCEHKFQANLQQFKERQTAIGVACSELAKRLDEKRKIYDSGVQLSNQIANLLNVGEFPVVFNGATYSKEQLTSQLKLTLAQVDGLRASIDEMEQTAEKAEASVQKIVVQIEQIESQLAMLATRREIFKTNKLTDVDLTMFQECRDALEENDAVLNAGFNPVRTIEQLLNSQAESSASSSDARVEEYLREFREKKEQTIETNDIPDEPVVGKSIDE